MPIDIRPNASDQYLRAVEALSINDDRLDRPTDPNEAAIRCGQAAWARLKKESAFEDWKQVGFAHEVGRTLAMRQAHVNKPEGKGYNAAFSQWQKLFGFDDLDKGDRSRLFEMMEHLAEIEAWRATLTVTQRLNLNHPTSVVRKWKKATTTYKPDLEPRLSPYKKLEADHIALIDERDRMKHEIERGGGDLWTVDDRPRDIARVILGKLSKAKAKKVAREILAALKEAK